MSKSKAIIHSTNPVSSQTRLHSFTPFYRPHEQRASFPFPLETISFATFMPHTISNSLHLDGKKSKQERERERRKKGKKKRNRLYVVSSSFTRCINTERVIPFPLETISFTTYYTLPLIRTHTIYSSLRAFLRRKEQKKEREKKKEGDGSQRIMVALVATNVAWISFNLKRFRRGING